MNDPDFYNIVNQGTFFIETKPCDRIEDLTDSFIAKEKLDEMTGETSHWGNRIYLGHKIMSACKEWADLIPSNAICTSKITPLVRNLLDECHPSIIRRYIEQNYTVRGRRIININKQSKNTEKIIEQNIKKVALAAQATLDAPYVRSEKPTNSDLISITETVNNICKNKYGASFINLNFYNKRCKIIIFCKRLCSWEDVAKQYRISRKSKIYRQDLPYMKQVWNDPTFLNL